MREELIECTLAVASNRLQQEVFYGFLASGKVPAEIVLVRDTAESWVYRSRETLPTLSALEHLTQRGVVVKIVAGPKFGSVMHARRVACQAASWDIVALMDDDVVFLGEDLDRLVTSYKAFQGGCGFVVPALWNSGPKVVTGDGFNTHYEKDLREDSYPIHVATLCCLVTSKSRAVSVWDDMVVYAPLVEFVRKRSGEDLLFTFMLSHRHGAGKCLASVRAYHLWKGGLWWLEGWEELRCRMTQEFALKFGLSSEKFGAALDQEVYSMTLKERQS